MKKQSKLPLFTTLLLLIISTSAGAQAPSITYSPATSVFSAGTAIAALTPSNSGGNVPANTYATVVTFAGNVNGLSGNGNGSVSGSRFANPGCTTIDYTNNLMYIADAGNNLIRRIDLTANTVSTFAGSGSAAEADGTGLTASFNAPYAITYDGSGTLYVADYGGNTIRKIITSTGTVSTIATGLNSPAGIVYDPVSTSLYVSNSSANTILKMSATGSYLVYAGSGTAGSADGPGTGASFNVPNGMAVDASGNLYVADENNNTIRKISSGGTVTTFATGFVGPRGVDADIAGNLYVSDNSNLIYLVSAGGTVTAIAGNGSPALLDGVGTGAEFNQATGVCVYKTTGDIYVSDYGNNVIRKITGTGYLIAPTLPTGLSFTSSTGKISGTPSSISSQATYTITAFNSSGSNTTSISIQCVQTNNWTAGANTALWTTGANWSAGSAPGPNDIVQIGVSAYSKNKQPTIAASTTVYSIIFGPYGGTNSTKFASPTLTVNNGTLKINTALTANANTTATITGNSGSSLVMAPGSLVTVNGTGLTISTTNFKLQSDATGSASIGPVTTSNFITSGTTVTVERYLPGIRGWVLLSSPVNGGSTTVSGNTIKVYDLNYLLNSTYVSGTGFSTSGFSKNGNPSLFFYRENFLSGGNGYTQSNYRAVTSIPTTTPPTVVTLDGTYSVPIGNGYELYFRGGTDTPTPFVSGTPAYPATLAATGTLNQGSVIFTHWNTPGTPGLLYTKISQSLNTEGFNLVGNPYACTIDLDTYNSGGISMSSDVSQFVYELNPQSGNYNVYTLGSGTSDPLRYIASGQGFFVQANSTSATLTFNESCKSIGQQNTGANLLLSKGPVATVVQQYLRLRMAIDSINADETVIKFNGQAKTNYVFNEDALYMPGNGRVSLSSISSDNRPMAINTRPLATRGDTIKLNVSAANGTYSISLKAINGIPQLYDIWLMDAYKKDSLDLRHNSTYSFDVNRADTNTYGANRFKIIMRQNPAYAYRLLSFTAARVGNSSNVETHWTTANEQNNTNFTVERSSDGGETFTVAGGIRGTGAGDYGLMDKTAMVGTNLYRLKQEDFNGTITYSPIATVVITDKGNGNADALLVYPNPATSVINLDMRDKNGNTSYNIIVSNGTGFVVKQAISSQGNWQANISDLLPGTYVIRVINNKTQNLMGESKFVKL